jgi:hypothetical protein
MYDPDRTYLDVDFTGTPGYANGFNQFAKDCGAHFNWEKRLFYIPTDICPMAALCVFPAISYARHLSVQIVKYQRDQGMAPSLRQVDDHLGLVRPQRMLVPLIPFSRVRVVVGPGARDRVVRNRRTMSSVIIGMMTFMTCMVPAESALSMTAHHHSASVFANEVNPIVYWLLAAGAFALTVFMLHQHHGRVGTAAELNRDLLGMFLLRQRLNRAPTEREIEAERQRLYVVQYIQDHGFSPLSPPPSQPASPTSVVPVPPLPSEFSPVSDDEYPYAPEPGGDEPSPTRAQFIRAVTTIAQTEAFIDDINAAEAERLAAMTVPTPRSLRYNRRSGHLQLALLMCCFGEVQSSAIVLSTSAPLYGPLAMIACLVLIAALGAALYDYISIVPTADTIVLPDRPRVVSASEI